MTPLLSTPRFTIHAITESRDPRVQDLLDRVCRKHKVGVRDMLDRSKFPRLVKARHEFWWLCARELNMTSGEIEVECNHEASAIRVAIGRYQKKFQEECNATQK